MLGTEPGSPALQADSLLSQPPGKPMGYLEKSNSETASRTDYQGLGGGGNVKLLFNGHRVAV